MGGTDRETLLMIESLRDEIRLLRGSLEGAPASAADQSPGVSSSSVSPSRRSSDRWLRRLGRSAADALFIFIILAGLFLLVPHETGPPRDTSAASPIAASGSQISTASARPSSPTPVERLYKKSARPTGAAFQEARVEEQRGARNMQATDNQATGTEAMATGGIAAEIEEQISAWAAAWSRRDVDAYLDSYSTKFQPANGSSRQTWVQHRRSRVGARHPRSVELSQMTVEIQGERAEARFVQAYTSPTFRDRVPKTLILQLEEERWKILEERTRQSS